MKPYQKQKPIIDEALLNTYRKMKCCVCGGTWQVAGHHHVLRSKLQMDIPSNLSPLCIECHTQWHSSPMQFVRLHGEEMYKQLGEIKENYDE